MNLLPSVRLLRHKKFILFILLSFIFLMTFSLMSSFLYRSSESRGSLKQIMKKKELHVLTRNANTTYYIDREGETGFEYDMVSEFAAWLGVDLRFTVDNNVASILESIKVGRADIAAAGLTRTELREKELMFGPDYFSSRQVLVVHKENRHIDSAAEMQGVKIVIPGGASYLETLETLSRQYPDLKWEVSWDLSSEEIISKVAAKEIDCTIADENIFLINQRYFPSIRKTVELSEEEYFAWIIGRNGGELRQKISEWFEEFEGSPRHEQILHKYYDHAEEFDYVDLRTFHKRVETVLPRYRELFMQAGEDFGLDWTLIAALSYQESHWKRTARSRTGVRGMMMLTRATASELNISNRLDVEESIMGGALYLRRLLDRIPEEVHQEDRIAYAMAAYNVGLGHLKDAMQLAEELGRDPYTWHEIKWILPLLSQRKYYSQLKHGYARGSEPVQYVTRIFNYKEILDNLLGEIP